MLMEGRDMTEKYLPLKETNLKLECKNRYPIYDENGGKMAKLDTPSMTKTAEKPDPFWPHIPI